MGMTIVALGACNENIFDERSKQTAKNYPDETKPFFLTFIFRDEQNNK